MLSREMHLKQVNRFHDLREKLTAKIDAINAIVPKKEFHAERYEYLKAYVQLCDAWPTLDDACEEIETELDIIEFGLKEIIK